MPFRPNNSRAAKLQPEHIQEIRLRYAQGETQGRLSREFGVSIGQIGRIVRGESWQQLPLTENSQQDIGIARARITAEAADASAERFRQMLDQGSATTGTLGTQSVPSLYADPPPVAERPLSEAARAKFEKFVGRAAEAADREREVGETLDKLKAKETQSD